MYIYILYIILCIYVFVINCSRGCSAADQKALAAAVRMRKSNNLTSFYNEIFSFK